MPDRLITGQFCNHKENQPPPNDVGRVARWPLDGSTGQLQLAADGMVHAMEAYRLAKDQVQGAVSDDDAWYLGRSTGQPGRGRGRQARGGADRHADRDRHAAGRHWAGGPVVLAGAERAVDAHRAPPAADALRRAALKL